VIEVHPSAFGERIDWLEDKQPQPYAIISGRKRLDNQWGFQCVCGENDLMTAQEVNHFTNPASPTPQQINDVVKSLIVDKPKFRMVAI
jgi:hypothetical protein